MPLPFTADWLPKTLPLCLGEHLNPPTRPLAVSPCRCATVLLRLADFCKRAPACKNRSAAPASPRCFCRRQRSVQLPPPGDEPFGCSFQALRSAEPEGEGIGFRAPFPSIGIVSGKGAPQPCVRRSSLAIQSPAVGPRGPAQHRTGKSSLRHFPRRAAAQHNQKCGRRNLFEIPS